MISKWFPNFQIPEYPNDIDDIQENIDECNPNKKQTKLIPFDDMNADMLRYKKLDPIVIESFIRRRKLNISLFFCYTIYFAVLKKY